MKPTDDLHTLIHALSQAEKRYIRVFSSRHPIGDGNNYMLLFDEILKQEEYDEEKIKKKLSKEKSVKHLPSEKNYLYRLILKAMRTFHSEKDTDASLAELMHDARYLYGKGLYEQSMKVLKKARKHAIAYERFPALMQVTQLEKKILLDKYSDKVDERYDLLNEENAGLQDEYRLTEELSELKDRLYLLQMKRFQVREEDTLAAADELMKHPLLQSAAGYQSFQARQLFYSVHILNAQVKGDNQKLEKHYKALISLWKSDPVRIKADSGEYRKILSNYLSYSHSAEKLDEFNAMLAEVKAIAPQTDEEEAAVFKNVYFLELLYYMNTGRLDEAENMVPKIELGLQSYKAHISESRRLAIYYNIATMYFLVDKPKLALQWVNDIINHDKTESRGDIQNFARILQLILHYDLGNVELLDYLLRSVQRYLQRKGTFHDFEAAVIQHLRKLAWMQDEQEIGKQFVCFKDDLEKLLNDPLQRKALGLGELTCWVQSKIEHKPLARILQREREKVFKEKVADPQLNE